MAAICVFVSCYGITYSYQHNSHFSHAHTDNNSCESTCEQHCASSMENKCACDCGYYLASDHISCIGKCMYQVYVPV